MKLGRYSPLIFCAIARLARPATGRWCVGANLSENRSIAAIASRPSQHPRCTGKLGGPKTTTGENAPKNHSVRMSGLYGDVVMGAMGDGGKR